VSTHSRLRRVLAAVGALAVGLLGACSSSNDSKETSDGLTTVKVAVSSKIAYYLPYLMEPYWKEFEKQGIAIEMEYGSAPDMLVLLTTGRVDVLVTGPSANILNAAADGADLKFVAPGAVEAEESPNGWYVSTAALAGRTYSPELLKGQTLASSSGVAGPPLLTLSQELAKANLTLADVTIRPLSSSDGLIAIENGAVFAGTVSAPNTAKIAESGAGTFIARSAPIGWPSVGVFFGPNLLNDRPEVGERFVTALLNIYRTYLQGDFMKGEWADEFAEVLEVDVNLVTESVSPTYPTTLTFPENYFEAYEAAWRQIPDVLTYGEDRSVAANMIDTRFADYANAHAS
jgi:ABC-type nitrate/sulfonate/bicarbonate transport system substrate-binding protein